MAKPRILLISTGGTIAMQADGPNVGGVLKLGAAGLLQSVPELAAIADVEGCDLIAKPSAGLTIDDIQLLVETVDAAQNADGVVVTHGTDTLEETAFALQLLLKSEVPVVLTGAMRRADLPGADGPANILDSCRVAASPEARGKGVLVVMNSEIHSAQTVRKAHSFLPSAFQSLGPLGWVAEDRVRFLLTPAATLPRLGLGKPRPNVAVIEIGLGFDCAILELLRDAAVDGIVVSVTGAGHVAASAVEDLEALARVKPVVFASRTGRGETFRENYSYPGSETDLIKRGLVPAGYLTERQARLALLFLLSEKAGQDRIRAYFESFSS